MVCILMNAVSVMIKFCVVKEQSSVRMDDHRLDNAEDDTVVCNICVYIVKGFNIKTLKGKEWLDDTVSVPYNSIVNGTFFRLSMHISHC